MFNLSLQFGSGPLIVIAGFMFYRTGHLCALNSVRFVSVRFGVVAFTLDWKGVVDVWVRIRYLYQLRMFTVN